MKQTTYQMIVKEQLHEVLQLGYQLSQEDMQELLKTQKEACKAAKMIDIDHHIIFELARQFVKSPYIQITTYVALVKQSLFSYYVVRRELKGMYDDELVMLLYETYIKHQGEFSKECIFDCIQRGRAR